MRTEMCIALFGLSCSLFGCPASTGPTTSEPLAIQSGGTGAENARDARRNLDAASLSESNTFTSPQTFVGPVIVQSSAPVGLAQNGQPKLLELRDSDDHVVASVDDRGTIVGLSARVDKIQSAVVTSDKFVGSGEDLTGVPAIALEDLEFAKLDTMGCVLTGEPIPDCNACPGGRCQIAFNGFPNFNWMKIGSYTIAREGLIDVRVDRTLMCDRGVHGVVRLDLIAEEGATPGVNPAVILGSTDVRIHPGTANIYQFLDQEPLIGSTFTPTEESLEVGKAYIIYVKGTINEGSADCFLGTAKSSFRFSPMSGTQIAIPQ